jgi:hypothetical protein
MENCKSTTTLVNINNKKWKLDKNPLTPKEKDMRKYLFKKKLDVWCMQWVCTRLDISFVMGQADKFQGMFSTCDIVIG